MILSDLLLQRFCEDWIVHVSASLCSGMIGINETDNLLKVTD